MKRKAGNRGRTAHAPPDVFCTFQKHTPWLKLWMHKPNQLCASKCFWIQYSYSPTCWPSADCSFDPSYLTPPLSAVPHVPPTTSNSQLSSQSVFESSVMIPDAPHFPLARHSKPSSHPSYHPPNYSQIFCTLPLTPQPPGQTNRQLYSSRPDCHVPEILT